ncbi:MAG TPA: cytochrome c maturation protein CcmE [Actinomycetota bacterium]|nr:cytochrome c maturation protein CcmE [Actinomycetota bacterium]
MDHEAAPIPKSPRRAKFLVGGLIVVATLVGLVVWAMARPGSTAYYLSPTELAAQNSTSNTARILAQTDVRLNGTVVPGSIERDGLATSFLVTDGATEVAVKTDRPLPDAFMDRSEIVALGNMEADTFIATEVLAKCPSKFKARA